MNQNEVVNATRFGQITPSMPGLSGPHNDNTVRWKQKKASRF